MIMGKSLQVQNAGGITGNVEELIPSHCEKSIFRLPFNRDDP
jgi:hypothetical protein